MKIIIYTTSMCSGCRMLKTWLKKHHLIFEEKNVEDTKVLAELIFAIDYVSTVPILEVDGKFYIGEEIEKWMEEYGKSLD